MGRGVWFKAHLVLASSPCPCGRPTMAGRVPRSAARRRERWIRSMWRHEQLSVRMALVTAAHHSSQRTLSAATQTDAAPAPVDEHIAPAPAERVAPAPAVYAVPATVNAYAAPAPDLNLASILEPLVPVVQLVQDPQVQIIEKIVEILESLPAKGTQTSEILGTAPA